MPFPGLEIIGAGSAYNPSVEDDPDDDFAGARVAGIGDVNGDGLNDIAVAAPYATALQRSYAGTVDVIFGRRTPGRIDLAHLGNAGYEVVGPQAGRTLGVSLASAGDVNGDGIPDLVAGTTPGVYRPYGGAWVIFGQRQPGIVDLAQRGHGYPILGGRRSRSAGIAVAGIGDVNRDGIPDAAVGAPYDGSLSGAARGDVYVVFGHRGTQPVHLDHLNGQGYWMTGPRGSATGTALAGPGDVNGDGIPDVLIGAPSQSDVSATPRTVAAAYLVYGNPRATRILLSRLGSQGAMLTGTANDEAGMALAAAGDINGDGHPDLLIAAPRAQAGCRAAAGIVYGIPGANLRPGLLTALATRGAVVAGAQPADEAGTDIATVPDLDGDHRPDIAVASPAPDVDIPLVHNRPVFTWTVAIVSSAAARGAAPSSTQGCVRLTVPRNAGARLKRTGELTVTVRVREASRRTALSVALLIPGDPDRAGYLGNAEVPLGHVRHRMNIPIRVTPAGLRTISSNRPIAARVVAHQSTGAGGGCCDDHSLADSKILRIPGRP